MKKIYALLLIAFVGGSVFGQQKHEITSMVEKTIEKPAMSSQKTSGVIDTLVGPISRATGFFFLSAGSAGYPTGTNSVSGETGQYYDAQGTSAVITELMVYFVHKEQIGPEDTTLMAYAYDAGIDSFPSGSPIASGTYRFSDIDTSGLPTFIPLTVGTGQTTGPFVVSIFHENTQTQADTIVLLTNNPTGDGNGEDRLLMNLVGYAWFHASDIWTFGGAPMDGDALICPIVDVTPVGINEGITMSGLTLKAHYPNPAVDHLNIRYALDQAREVKITVFDGKGQIIKETPLLSKTAGDHEAYVDLTSFAAGKYYYRVDAGGAAQWTSRFIVVK